MPKPDLSLVIPTLNEAEALPLLLEDLAHQQGLSFEVIIADGGSADLTCQLANDFFLSGRLSGRHIIGPSGRGRQLNAGALATTSDWLLFLHADSRLGDINQLQTALGFMRCQQQQLATDALAGHFSLRFDSCADEDRFGFFYYETKASLGRPGSISGDQGMLLTKSYFYALGTFRQDLSIMEDTDFAKKVFADGEWLLLPGEIVTSARRFQVEGLKSRQTLNALMMNFYAIGWFDFFAKAPEVYRQQDRTQPLKLLPFLHLIRALLGEMSLRKRLGIWLATGAYVRSQAWQVGLALDCRKAFRDGVDSKPLAGRWLQWFERWFEPLTNHYVGRVLTALFVRIWFAWQLQAHALDDKSDNNI